MIEHAASDEQIAATFDVMRQLRPHLTRETYVPLISRVVREEAHRFYFREGLGIECFHFRIKL
jgi:hypothetical protein